MFFVDSTGFFSLICLLIQCVLAWVFGAFFAMLAHGRAPWLHSFQVAFIGLGMGLTALCVRFVLAYHSAAGDNVLVDGALAARLFLGVYLAGKLMFMLGLLRGIAAWRGRGWRKSSKGWLTVLALGFAVGFGLHAIEDVLLFQAPLVIATCGKCVWLLRRSDGEPLAPGRGIVRGVLVVTALVWVMYVPATVFAMTAEEPAAAPLSYVLRLNSLIDLVLQVILATGLIVALMGETQRSIVAAHEERDRLLRQVQRDDKLRAMATLVSGVAHEINNPLTAILGFCEDLEADDAGVRVSAARIVREQADRCRKIVQRMSVIGRRRVVAGAFDVGQQLQRVLGGLRPQFDMAGVEVRCRVGQGILLEADATGFAQVATNLLTNAAHVTARGGKVELSVEEEPDAVTLFVRDHGPGISPTDRSRVFEPFWTTKRTGEGTGLGLAVVDAIVHAHGGQVEVDDADGGGTVFRVTWPRQQGGAAEPAEPIVIGAGPAIDVVPAGDAVPEVCEQGAVPLSGGCRLLVIDDEPLVRLMIRRHAQGIGWHVVDVESAESGLEELFAGGRGFDAVVCDLRMPGLSGVGFHDEVARRSPELLARTLFITGDLASPEAVAFAERCRSSIVTKPFVMTELFQRLGEMSRVG